MNIHQQIQSKFGIYDNGIMPLIGKLDRNSLGELFCELGYKVGAEIGVFYGQNAEVLLRTNPGLKLYCVDPWSIYKGRSFRWPRVRFRRTQQLLASYNVEYIRKMSMDAIADIEDGSLDFVYIDADHHYSFVKDDIREWSKKVRIGGIVSGHDYIDNYKCLVKSAVDEYIREHNINPWYLTVESPLPSWFFVK